ncbi:MAG: hypothetical protein AB7O66_16545 [Limisphaerales bacterium]
MTRFKSRPGLVAVSCLILMSATGWFLHQRASLGHRLGKPGLRVVEVPLPGEDGKPATTHSIPFPESPLEFRSEVQSIKKMELDWLPRDTTFGRRLYTAPDGFQSQVTAVLMGTDRTSIHKPEFCLPSQGFQIVKAIPTEIILDRPHRYALPVMRLDALREGRLPNGQMVRHGAVYIYWFVSENRLSNNHLQRMGWLALDLIRTGELQRWAYIGCLAACHPGQEDATYLRLERLIQSIAPEFQITAGPALSLGPASPAPGADGGDGVHGNVMASSHR